MQNEQKKTNLYGIGLGIDELAACRAAASKLAHGENGGGLGADEYKR